MSTWTSAEGTRASTGVPAVPNPLVHPLTCENAGCTNSLPDFAGTAGRFRRSEGVYHVPPFRGGGAGTAPAQRGPASRAAGAPAAPAAPRTTTTITFERNGKAQ